MHTTSAGNYYVANCFRKIVARFSVQCNPMRYGIWNTKVSNNKINTKKMKVPHFLRGFNADSISKILHFRYFNRSYLFQSDDDQMMLISLRAGAESLFLFI
jgi:hypothetical protein